MHAMDGSNQFITDYDCAITDVPFRQGYITTACGTYFRYVTTSSLTFNLTRDTLSYEY